MRLIATAASGVHAQQVALDTLGNNMANVDTLGFKENQTDFAEALATVVNAGNTAQGGNFGGPLSVGSGVLYNATGTNFKQGALVPTDRSLDLGIDGAGFFQVLMSDGTTGYTRVGALQVDGSGRLTDQYGNVVQPSISIPSDTTGLTVAANGELTGSVKGANPTNLGQISLVGFQNPEGLQNAGNNIFKATPNSGTPQIGQPGTTIGNQVLGTIRGQSLEQSNVDLATSMTDLIQVQRAYQLSARLISDGDQMWGTANSLRR